MSRALPSPFDDPALKDFEDDISLDAFTASARKLPSQRKDPLIPACAIFQTIEVFQDPKLLLSAFDSLFASPAFYVELVPLNADEGAAEAEVEEEEPLKPEVVGAHHVKDADATKRRERAAKMKKTGAAVPVTATATRESWMGSGKVKNLSTMFQGCAWPIVGVFLCVQFGCWKLTGDSFFGYMTNGVVESFKLDTVSWSKVHMVSGATMWILAGFQFVGKPFRQGQLAWIHRTAGRLLISLWFFIVGPTAIYLSVRVGIGQGRNQFIMTLFTWVSLDTAFYAYYLYWRGMWIARYKVNGAASIQLHKKCMELGTAMTMTILAQRPLQFGVICFRGVLLVLAQPLPSFVSWLIASVLDHNVILSLTTCFFGCALLGCIDGPRSGFAQKHLFSLEEAWELFGTAKPGTLELWCWRLRPLITLVLRGIVTQGWTVDPVSAAPVN